MLTEQKRRAVDLFARHLELREENAGLKRALVEQGRSILHLASGMAAVASGSAGGRGAGLSAQSETGVFPASARMSGSSSMTDARGAQHSHAGERTQLVTGASGETPKASSSAAPSSSST